VRINRELSESVVEDDHVIRRGARPGVPGAEQAGQRFAGGVEEREQRVEPEAPLVGRGRSFLL
jgi:hypothetical protein